MRRENRKCRQKNKMIQYIALNNRISQYMIKNDNKKGIVLLS